MKRKDFLNQMALAGLSVSALSLTACKSNVKGGKPEIIAAKPPLFKLSLAQWSINRMIRKGEVSPYEFASLAKTWGFEGLEYVSQLYQDVVKSENPKQAMDGFVSKSNALAADHGLKNLLIMIDNEGDVASSDLNKRKEALENHKRWIEAASAMDCHSIRINLFGDKDPETWKPNAVEGLRSICEIAMPYNINIIVENHGGLTSDAKILMEAIEGAEMPNCGTLPDFGNFCVQRDSDSPWDGKCMVEYDKYKGMEEMMPRAFGVSAKSYDFDAEGNETSIDFARMLNIVKQSGFEGFIGVEYEGHGLSEKDGILATRDLLLRLQEEMA